MRPRAVEACSITLQICTKAAEAMGFTSTVCLRAVGARGLAMRLVGAASLHGSRMEEHPRAVEASNGPRLSRPHILCVFSSRRRKSTNFYVSSARGDAKPDEFLCEVRRFTRDPVPQFCLVIVQRGEPQKCPKTLIFIRFLLIFQCEMSPLSFILASDAPKPAFC